MFYHEELSAKRFRSGPSRSRATFDSKPHMICNEILLNLTNRLWGPKWFHMLFLCAGCGDRAWYLRHSRLFRDFSCNMPPLWDVNGSTLRYLVEIAFIFIFIFIFIFTFVYIFTSYLYSYPYVSSYSYSYLYSLSPSNIHVDIIHIHIYIHTHIHTPRYIHMHNLIHLHIESCYLQMYIDIANVYLVPHKTKTSFSKMKFLPGTWYHT